MSRSYAEFARPSYRDPRWLETHWFSALTTDGIRLHFWMGFRLNTGVATTKVYAFSQFCDSVLDMEMCDMQYNSPIGAARLSDFSLDSGVSVKGRPAPRVYDLTYRSACGRMTAELTFEALMEPADLSATKIPDGPEGFVAFHRGPRRDAPANRTGTEPSGHIDQTMAVRGSVTIDGIAHEVDCVANRDHSWSPRAEVGHTIGTFDLVHIGNELTLLTHTGESADGEPRVSHGYVLRDKEFRALKAAQVSYRREGLRIVGFDYRVVDERDVEYHITGRARGSAEIDGGQNIYLVMGLFDCEWDGRTGYGEVQWHDYITRMQGVRAAQRAVQPAR
ncbi:DUF7064 domain-containing protein [Mycolicibacterium parafortuitum]|uniref:DUF7064 domain-containing protein n=1 Tax=Mycolicibacterium parafortuitum TaxID=39692 RepID=A0A375YB77_MYCPF|nr:hypothetical protein [Mycolicibacterium parafortuitum]ORB31761.1 hypothetical protein BST38_03095 [Mycolicibacterium parafortuitum]SRX78323.1 hypothetical protein MPP7335_00046 [Mycolicibacterium parafortuitum]